MLIYGVYQHISYNEFHRFYNMDVSPYIYIYIYIYINTQLHTDAAFYLLVSPKFLNTSVFGAFVSTEIAVPINTCGLLDVFLSNFMF